MQLFLDCDGVLADFDRGFEDYFKMSSRGFEDQNGSERFWKSIQHGPNEFFRNLPLMPDAQELFDAVKHLRPIILTGCPRGNWAELQKIEWARDRFPGTPLVTCMSRDKRDYCLSGDVIVDDYTKHRARWIGAGGIFVHHTSTKTSLAELHELGVV